MLIESRRCFESNSVGQIVWWSKRQWQRTTCRWERCGKLGQNTSAMVFWIFMGHTTHIKSDLDVGVPSQNDAEAAACKEWCAQVFERRLITCWTREEVNNQGSRVQIALLDFLVFSLLMMSTYTHDRLWLLLTWHGRERHVDRRGWLCNGL